MRGVAWPRKRWLTHPARRAALLTVIVGITVMGGAAPALAHPLGNFTTNSYLGVTVTEDRVLIDHVLDLAEIPTLQTVQRIDLAGNGMVDAEEGERYRNDTCSATADEIEVRLGGTVVPVEWSGQSTLAFPPGEAGLDTLRLECRLEVEHELASGSTDLHIEQPDLDGRIGWREITIVGDGVTVSASDAPVESISGRLVDYPEQRLASPLDIRSATAAVQPGGPGDVGLPVPDVVPDSVSRGVDRVSSWFTGLVAVERLTLPFALLAVVVAVGLGTLHALAPGHGKTVMAAYLVGRQGTTRDALLLGGTVAVTHTLGVFLLGVLLSASESASPQRIYPWLGAGSGLLFALVGMTLLRQALRGDHDHHHGPGGHTHGPGGHDHGLGGHDHELHDDGHDRHNPGHRGDHGDEHHSDHGHDHHGHDADVRAEGAVAVAPHTHADAVAGPQRRRSTGWRGLLAPGLAGGLVPSPSALLVLLGGFAIGRAWFGVGLVVAYGVGMAATLVGAGYLLLRARHRIQQAVEAKGGWSRAAALFRWLPVVTSSLIIVGGLVIVGRSLLFV